MSEKTGETVEIRGCDLFQFELGKIKVKDAFHQAKRPALFRERDDHGMTNGEKTSNTAWPGGITAITLFVEDLETAKQFYQDVFHLPVFYEDGNSAVFKFGETLVNLLRASEAPGLIAPAPVAAAAAGTRFQFTLDVEDVDATCERLRERGVELLNGPIDRPWGIRTASFRDPGGHIWEIAH